MLEKEECKETKYELIEKILAIKKRHYADYDFHSAAGAMINEIIGLIITSKQ